MSLRVRADGRVLCAAMHPEQPGDIYIDDGLHYRLSVELGVLVTEPMHSDRGRGGHAQHGEWWWRGLGPPDAVMECRDEPEAAEAARRAALERLVVDLPDDACPMTLVRCCS